MDGAVALGRVAEDRRGADDAGAVAAGPAAPRRGDINLDGFVGAPDLAALLNAWGPATGAVRADLNASGGVDAQDLAILLSLW